MQSNLILKKNNSKLCNKSKQKKTFCYPKWLLAHPFQEAPSAVLALPGLSLVYYPAKNPQPKIQHIALSIAIHPSPLLTHPPLPLSATPPNSSTENPAYSSAYTLNQHLLFFLHTLLFCYMISCPTTTSSGCLLNNNIFAL